MDLIKLRNLGIKNLQTIVYKENSNTYLFLITISKEYL